MQLEVHRYRVTDRFTKTKVEGKRNTVEFSDGYSSYNLTKNLMSVNLNV